MVFPLLAKAVSQPRKSGGGYEDRDGPFHNRGADALGIGTPINGTTSTEATSEGEYRTSSCLKPCENVRGLLVALAHCDVEHQLAVLFDCNERVSIPKVLIVLRSNALCFSPV